MKRVFFVAFTISLYACNSQPTTVDKKNGTIAQKREVKNEITIPSIPPAFVEKNLSDKGFPIKIMAPKEAVVYTSVLTNDEGTQDQLIVQMSDASILKLRIFKSGLNIGKAKTNLEKDVFKKFEKYLYQDATSSFVKTVDFMDKTKDIYDFVVVIEKDGKFIHICPEEFKEPPTKDQVLELYAIAKSFK